MEKTVKKLYDAEGNWIGMDITEVMTKAEAQERYPHLVFIDIPEKWPWED